MWASSIRGAGSRTLPETVHNGPSGQWLRDKILVPLGYRRTDCWITDCLDTARLNAGGGVGQPDIRAGRRPPRAPHPEHGADPDRREHRSGGEEGHEGDCLQGLDAARPELIMLYGERGPLGPSRLLVEIDSGDPRAEPRPEPQLWSREVRARLGARPVRWLPPGAPPLRRANAEMAADPHALGGANP